MLDRSGAAVRTRRLSKRCGFSTSTRAAYKLLLARCDRRQYEYVEYKGYNGSVVIESDGLMIRREGLSRAMSAASPSRWVPLTAISDVSLHPSTRLTNGWITLGVMGNAARQLGAGTGFGPRHDLVQTPRCRDVCRTARLAEVRHTSELGWQLESYRPLSD